MPNQPLPTPTPPVQPSPIPVAPVVPTPVQPPVPTMPPVAAPKPAMPAPQPVAPMQPVPPVNPALPPQQPLPPKAPALPPTGPMVPPPPGVRPPAPTPVIATPSATLPQPPKSAVVPPAAPPKPPTSGGAASAQPPAGGASRMAAVRQSPLRFLPIILGVVAVIGVIVFLALRLLGGSSSPTTPSGTTNQSGRTQVPARQTTITYWGLWEPSAVLQEVFQDYEAANPDIKIEYVQQSHIDYRERLQTAIASGNGPDIFRFHASWTPMLRNELSPVPSSVYSSADFQRLFYPSAVRQLQLNNQFMGVPLMYDGLALYYNVDILRLANAQPPKTWAELKTLATQLTVRSGSQIQRGGLAIGTTGNVEHFSDILGLLMIQNGADPANPTTRAAQDALAFYTDFYTKDRVWSETLPNSTTAFARGDAAMMFAPSWRVFEIKAMNPSLNFATAPVPKLGSVDTGWATFWAEGVNTRSNEKDEAWQLLKYLSSAEVMRKLHSEQSTVRAFGEIHSRTDLANELASQPLVVPFLSDAPKAQSWYLNSYTHDSGINDQIIKYYGDAINAVLQGRKPEEVLPTVAQGVSQVLRQYGVVTTTGATTGPGSATGTTGR